MVRVHNGPPVDSKKAQSSSTNPEVTPTEHNPRTNPQSYPDTPTQHSLLQLIDGYLLSCQLEGKADSTTKDYQLKLQRFIEFIRDKPIDSISPTDIREYLSHVKNKYRPSLATVERYKVALQSFYHWLADEDFVEFNPMTKVKIAKPDRKLIQSLNPPQMSQLLASFNGRSIDDYRNKAMVMVLLDTGLRCSELSTLKLQDVDTKRGIIKVLGKGRRERLARVGLKTQKAIWHYIVRRGDCNCDYSWLNPRGERLTRYGIDQMLCKLGRQLGFRLYPHLLRHSFVFTFLRNGANTFEVQYALGHSSLEMTRRYCSNLSFDDVYIRHQTASPIGNLK